MVKSKVEGSPSRVMSSVGYDNRSFAKFQQWTDQKPLLGSAISKHLPPRKRTLLDVGAANGDLTEHYINHFGSATLVEEKKALVDALTERFPDIEVLQQKIEEFVDERLVFDAIVASHVLIYVDDPVRTVDRLYDMLEPGGRLMIVMVDPKDPRHQFMNRFYPLIHRESTQANEIQAEEIVHHAQVAGYAYEIVDVTSTLSPPSVDDLIEISDFLFAFDGDLSVDAREQMKQYAGEHFVHEDRVCVEEGHKLIVIEKVLSG